MVVALAFAVETAVVVALAFAVETVVVVALAFAAVDPVVFGSFAVALAGSCSWNFASVVALDLAFAVVAFVASSSFVAALVGSCSLSLTFVIESVALVVGYRALTAETSESLADSFLRKLTYPALSVVAFVGSVGLELADSSGLKVQIS